MEIPELTKVINGRKHKYCGNHPNPRKVPNSSRLVLTVDQFTRGKAGEQEALENESRWLRGTILLEPVATKSYTVEELKKMDYVSVWKPPKDFERLSIVIPKGEKDEHSEDQ